MCWCYEVYKTLTNTWLSDSQACHRISCRTFPFYWFRISLVESGHLNLLGSPQMSEGCIEDSTRSAYASWCLLHSSLSLIRCGEIRDARALRCWGQLGTRKDASVQGQQVVRVLWSDGEGAYTRWPQEETVGLWGRSCLLLWWQSCSPVGLSQEDQASGHIRTLITELCPHTWQEGQKVPRLLNLHKEMIHLIEMIYRGNGKRM